MVTFDAFSSFRLLDSWVLAGIIQFATGRQYDQMTQAARSGKVNIVEGSARSAPRRKPK